MALYKVVGIVSGAGGNKVAGGANADGPEANRGETIAIDGIVGGGGTIARG